ncbi:MAG: glycosyltransferase 87 family protein [Thermodesulfobacteriota bacterium]
MNSWPQRREATGQRAWPWIASGLMLSGLHVVLWLVSSRFGSDTPVGERPVLSLTAILLLGGWVLLVTVYLTRLEARSRVILAWMVVVGVGMRSAMLVSTPMLEDDFYRYLWDGGLSANGYNPYTHSPAEVIRGSARVPDPLIGLARSGHPVIGRINNPEVRSIYPPVAQGLFALSYALRPWSLHAWRCLLLVFDGITLILVLTVLRSLGRSDLWAALYWWNPLVIKEVVNSAHLDVACIPFVFCAVIWALRGKAVPAAVALGLGVGVKVWPVVLAPVVVSCAARHGKRLLPAIALFLGMVGAMAALVYASGMDGSSGFSAYAQRWERNDALFMALRWGVESVLRVLSWNPGSAGLISRALVGAALVGWIGWVCRKPAVDPDETWQRCLSILAAVFLLSPTQFPWYYVWVVPFLAICPRGSLILLGVLLPIYYLRFHFEAQGRQWVFDHWIVWLEYVPVWGVLWWECAGGKGFYQKVLRGKPF